MIQNVVENRVLQTRIFSVLPFPSHFYSDAVWLCHRHLLLRYLYLTPSPLAAILAIHPYLHPLLNSPHCHLPPCHVNEPHVFIMLRIYRVYDSFKIVQCITILMICFLKYRCWYRTSTIKYILFTPDFTISGGSE
jgi:hypothetical protein